MISRTFVDNLPVRSVHVPLSLSTIRFNLKQRQLDIFNCFQNLLILMTRLINITWKDVGIVPNQLKWVQLEENSTQFL